MPASNVPAELTDLALNALEDEVDCWRRIPMYPGVTRLMRFPALEEIDLSHSSAAITDNTESVIYHDVPTKSADALLMRFAMEKVVEAVLGAVSVASE
jgi:hypothetical protein